MKKRFFLLVVVLLLVMAALCGCSKKEFEDRGDGKTLVIIAGRHANAKMYTESLLREIKLEKLITEAFSYYRDGDYYCAEAKIRIIVPDGSPEFHDVIHDGKVIELYADSRNVTNLDADVKAITSEIVEFLMSDDLKANDPEVNLVGAISLASDFIDMYPGVENHIVILDTGINTAGYLNMTMLNIQEGTVDEVMDRLADGARLNLDEVRITFAGLGNISTIGQADLAGDSILEARLEDIWTTFLEKICGAKLTRKIVFAPSEGEDMVYNETDTDSYPYVTSVPFVISADNTLYEEEKEEVVKDKEEEVIKFNTNVLGFVADKAVLRDEQITRDTIADCKDDIQDVLNENPNAIFYVVGSIAKTTPDGEARTDDLARKRAEKVAELLMSECGLREDQIVIIDAGTTKFSWRDNEEFPGGRLDSNAQQGNRVVAIVPSVYENHVQELKDKGYLE